MQESEKERRDIEQKTKEYRRAGELDSWSLVTPFLPCSEHVGLRFLVAPQADLRLVL